MNLNKRRIFSALIIIAFAGLVYLCVVNINWFFRAIDFIFSVLGPFLVGGMMAFLLNILMSFLEEKVFGKIKAKWFLKIKRGLCLVLTLIIVNGILAVLIVSIVPELGETLGILATQVPEAMKELQATLEQQFQRFPEISSFLANLNINWEAIWDSCISFLSNGAGGMLESTVGMATGFFSAVVQAFIGFIFAIYVLAQKEKLGVQINKIFKAFLNEKKRTSMLHFFQVVDDTFSKFMTGRLLDSCLLAVTFYVLMSIFQLPYALLTAAMVGITALIPILGSWMGGIIGALFMLTEGPQAVIIYLVIHCIVRPIDENVVYPKIVQKSVKLPAIWVLVAVTVGGSLYGIIGMLVFIPIASILYEYFKNMVNTRVQEKEQAEKRGESPDRKSLWKRLATDDSVRKVKHSEVNSPK